MHTAALPVQTPMLPTRLRAWGLALLMLVLAPLALADEDPPGRVGRLADFNGSVSWWDSDTGDWTEAERNRPLTSGDRVSTAQSGRAELRVGSTVLRLGARTEFEVLRLDDERLVFQLHSGSVAVRVRSREVADELLFVTDEARLRPLRAGHYVLMRDDDTTTAGAWRGEWHVKGDLRGEPGDRNERNEPGDRPDDGLIVGPERWAELYRSGRRGDAGELRSNWVAPREDGFTRWVLAEDGRDERSVSARYVSPEMTGVEDLDRHGRWEQHPEYGALWLPRVVAADWAPYRHGRWAWVRPWGWTWIDEAPWGFAPFHYGRWVHWRGRWGWVPGAYVARPVYAPALVAWVGGSGWNVSVRIGSPAVGWLPLAPREVYTPHYRHTPRYVERVNPPPPYRWRHTPGQVPTGPISYGNQGVPNAVTVVPGDVLVRRQPVAGGVVVGPQRDWGRAPLAVQAPPDGPAFIGPRAPRVQGPVMQPQRPERPERSERPDRFERPDRAERPTPPERLERPVMPQRPERIERPERPDRPEPPRRPEPVMAPAPVQVVPGGALPRPPQMQPAPAQPTPPQAMGPQRPDRAERPERPAPRPERPQPPAERADNKPERPRAPAPSERANGPDRHRDRQDQR